MGINQTIDDELKKKELRSFLTDGAGTTRVLTLELVAAFHDPLWSCDISDAPACHGVGLRYTVDDDAALLHTWELGYRLVLSDIVDVLVDLVCQHEEVFMFQDHVGQGLQLGLAVDATRRIARRTEDEHTGLRGDGCLQLLGGHLEILLETGFHDYGLTTCQLHHLGIAHPVGGRDDDFLTVVHQGHDGVADTLLGTVGDENLIDGVAPVVLMPLASST